MRGAEFALGETSPRPGPSEALRADRLEVRGNVLELTLKAGRTSVDAEVIVSDGGLSTRPDFLLPAALLPAMKTGLRLSLPPGASPRLLANSDEIQSIFALWNDEVYRRVPIEAPSPEPAHPPASSTACFFSGGVDSWSTVLKFLDEIDVLVFVDGVFHRRGRDMVVENARAAARELGKPLLEVETNFRKLATFRDANVTFSDYGGHFIGAIALLLQHRFDRILVASSFSYAALAKWGSHPLVDPLWSTEGLEVVHDGSELTRPMKVARLAESDIALRRLHVCNRGGRSPAGETTDHLNCARCSKCVRTMVNLRAAGVLERCETLPDTLDLDSVERLPVEDDRDLAFMIENLHSLKSGADPELEAAVKASLSRAELTEIGVMDYLFVQRRLAKAERQARLYRESLSWRITAPLRSLASRRARR